MKNTIIKFNRKKILINVLGSILISGLLLFILYESIMEFNIIAVILSLLSFLFFICIFIYSIYIFATDKPAIIITDDGITDNSNMFGVGFVSWRLIKHSALINHPNYVWLSLYVHDIESILSTNLSSITREVVKLNFKFYKSPIILSMTFCNWDAKVLQDEIQKHIQYYKDK